MKKIFFALPVLALTLLFTFCKKTEIQESTDALQPNTGVVDRGACAIEVYSDNIHAVRFCGTKTNKTACASCSSLSDQGVEVVNGNGSIINVTSPITFSVRTDSPGGSWINLVTANDQTGFVYIPAGGCQTFTLDDNCNFL